jgi:arylformamidase
MAENPIRFETSAETPVQVKGPLVWLDMDQKELDDAYDQSVYAPNQQLIATRRRLASEAMLKRDYSGARRLRPLRG